MNISDYEWHLIDCVTIQQGEVILDELLAEIEEIFSSGHDGVVSRMAELAVRLHIKQEEFQQAVLEAFHCTGKQERKKSAALILCMTTYDVMYGNDDKKDGSSEENKDEQTQAKDKVFCTTSFTLAMDKGMEWHFFFFLSLMLLFFQKCAN